MLTDWLDGRKWCIVEGVVTGRQVEIRASVIRKPGKGPETAVRTTLDPFQGSGTSAGWDVLISSDGWGDAGTGECR